MAVSRKLLIVALLAALATATAASAAGGRHARAHAVSVSQTELLPGVTYTREVDLTSAGPVVLDVLTLPKPDGTVYSLQPVLSNEKVAGGTETLTHIEQRLDTNATTVGIDGDYFNAKSGAPSSILMRGGVLDTEPNPGRSSLGIAADGTLQVAPVDYTGTWQASAGLRPLALNHRTAGYSLYTPSYGPTTPADAGATEVVFSAFPPTQAGRALDGVVTQVATNGPVGIPRGGAVLVGRGAGAAQLLQEAPVGQQVEVRLTLTPDWSGLAGAIGGGPLLVSGGKAVFPHGEEFSPGVLGTRDARGAVGVLADGSILLVTVEGGGVGYSVGLSTHQLALELAKLGATTAVGLGSGPAAGMAFNGKLLTRPSRGREAGVADALVLSYSGVYVPPVAPVLSPNGDGVAETETLSYRIVRPSTVTATLDGPGGTTIPLASGPQQPGTYTLTWDGHNGQTLAPEGSWTFDVSATDDRSVTTTAQQAFSLDDTLGGLSVVRNGSGYPVATFTLSRPADVVVSVQRLTGATVATVARSSLAAGTHHATWRGRAAGRTAPAGRYVMRVAATSSIGTSTLVASFSLPSHRRK